MLKLHFTTDLGAQVSVEVASPEQLLDVQRRFGRLGWSSGDIPPGGFQFPLDNAGDFDWSLLGGRTFQDGEGNTCVWARGWAWKIRVLEAVDSKKLKLPAAIKVSRGARPADPPHLIEKADGDFAYVTLAIFRGGRRNPAYATVSDGQSRRDAPNRVPGEAASPRPDATPPPPPARPPSTPHLSAITPVEFDDLTGIPNDGEETRPQLTEQLLDTLGKTGAQRDAYRRMLDKLTWAELQARHAQAHVMTP